MSQSNLTSIFPSKVSYVKFNTLNFFNFLFNFTVFRSVPSYFKWLSYLSWFKYGNEALLINQWADIDTIACTRANTTCPKNGHIVLETYNFSEVSSSLKNF